MENISISTVFASMACSGLLTFFLRTWISEKIKGSIQHEYSQKLEIIKLESKAAKDVELEKLRSQLAAIASERNAQVGALTTRRFEAIAEVHAALLRFHISLGKMVAPFRPNGTEEGELIQAVIGASRDFDEVFIQKQIFLTEKTAEKISEIRNALISNANQFIYTVANAQEATDRFDRWNMIDETVKGEIADYTKDIQRELRALMGDGP